MYKRQAIERIENSAIEELVLLNTIPVPEEKRIEKMKLVIKKTERNFCCSRDVVK